MFPCSTTNILSKQNAKRTTLLYIFFSSQSNQVTKTETPSIYISIYTFQSYFGLSGSVSSKSDLPQSAINAAEVFYIFHLGWFCDSKIDSMKRQHIFKTKFQRTVQTGMEIDTIAICVSLNMVTFIACSGSHLTIHQTIRKIENFWFSVH